jgi:hypothetical protein
MRLSKKVTITALTLLATLTIVPQAFAADVAGTAGTVEMTPAEVEYKNVSTELANNLKQLESLGGGIAPFVARQEEIDKAFNGGDHEQAAKDMTRLNRSIKDQLTDIKALRSAKPKKAVAAAPAAVQPASSSSTVNSLNLSPETMSALSKFIEPKQADLSKQNVTSYANFKGDADGFAEMVAKDIITRELGNLGIPCNGPFRLERFRNLHRINELKQKGVRIDGYLDHYRRTEELAAAAKRDGSRLAQLSGDVRYLEQQLGLSQLTGSLKGKNISSY